MNVRYWLILDCDNFMWRSYYGLKKRLGLDSTLIKSEITYQFLRDILALQKIHSTKRVVFCFDHAAKLRQLVYKDYKKNRKIDKNDPEHQTKKIVKQELERLKTETLKEVGFRNVFFQTGFESDDIIASVCQSFGRWDRGIIVSSDADFYQLLSKRVMVWHPIKKEAVTQKSFKRKYGIDPSQWALMKAIAGCYTDNVKGIDQVGEITALRYIRGELMTSSKAFKSITSKQGQQIIDQNLKLVTLPFEGVKEFSVKDDRLVRLSWIDMAELIENRAIQNHELFM